LTILASVGVDAAATIAARAIARAWRRTVSSASDVDVLTMRARAAIAAAGCAVSLACVSSLLVPSASTFLPILGRGSPARATRVNDELPELAPYACGDLARLAAGAWLERHAAHDEVLESAFGL